MAIRDPAAVPVGVLLYVNRSGSTLLSRMIGDRCAGVFVFPEMGFIVELLAARQAGRAIAGDALRRLIEADPRRPALSLSGEALGGICRDAGSHDIGGLLVRIAAAAGGAWPAAVLIKHEKLAYLTQAIDAAIADARILHIVRDPRAVVGSMLRTPVPEKPGFDMARGSPLFAARHWRDYLRRVDRLAARRPVLELRYEALEQDDGRAACRAVAALLGVTPAEGAPASRYRTAPIDRLLHPRIHDRFDARRAAGWRADLAPRDIRLIEATCGGAMAARGYAPVSDAPIGRGARLGARLRHAAAMIRHAAASALHHARRDPVAAVRMQVRMLLARRS